MHTDPIRRRTQSPRHCAIKDEMLLVYGLLPRRHIHERRNRSVKTAVLWPISDGTWKKKREKFRLPDVSGSAGRLRYWLSAANWPTTINSVAAIDKNPRRSDATPGTPVMKAGRDLLPGLGRDTPDGVFVISYVHISSVHRKRTCRQRERSALTFTSTPADNRIFFNLSPFRPRVRRSPVWFIPFLITNGTTWCFFL